MVSWVVSEIEWQQDGWEGSWKDFGPLCFFMTQDCTFGFSWTDFI